MKAYYVLIVKGTEADTDGPFDTYQERDHFAKRLWNDISDNLFWLDVDDQGVPHVGAFTDLND